MRFADPTPWLLVVLVALACSTPQVQTKMRPGADLSSYSRIHVRPTTPADPLPRSDSADADADAGINSDIDTELERRARSLLARRGYEITPAGQADLALQIHRSEQLVPRRVWSSDPDANYYVTRETKEAVLTVELLDGNGSQVVWRGEARSRLPQRDLILGPDSERIWTKALVGVLEELPAR